MIFSLGSPSFLCLKRRNFWYVTLSVLKIDSSVGAAFFNEKFFEEIFFFRLWRYVSGDDEEEATKIIFSKAIERGNIIIEVKLAK